MHMTWVSLSIMWSFQGFLQHIFAGPAVAGLNIYDILRPCYHGHNPYTYSTTTTTTTTTRAEQQQGINQGDAIPEGWPPGPSAPPAPQAPSPAVLQQALQSLRQWPLLGAVRPGRVLGFPELLLSIAPPCMDSR